jgi:hypothetical protein
MHHQFLSTATELGAKVRRDSVEVVGMISADTDLQQTAPRRLRNELLLTTFDGGNAD